MRRAACATLLAACACGLGPFDDAPGGRDNLPTRAAGPYSKTEIDFDTPADEPYVLFEVAANYRDPAPLPRADGGVRMWFTRQEPGSAEAAIWYAELPSILDLPDRAPEPALVAADPWEEGVVAEPSILDLGGGHLVMYYRGGAGAPAIGRADSLDDGASWERHPQNPVLAGAVAPAIARLPDGRLLLYHTVPGQPGIRVAKSEDGVSFQPREEPVVAPRPRLPEAFDPDAVGDPFALVTVPQDDSGLDRVHVGLFFAGQRPGEDPGEVLTSIGYAGSYDGLTFERFFGAEPVLDGRAPSEGGPAVLREGAGAILFFHEPRQARDRIAAAVHP